MDAAVASYIVRYYGYLMTKQEKLAHKHLAGTLKATHGRSDLAAQQEARGGSRHLREMLADDPEVLLLVSRGFQTFVEQTAERILSQHGEGIVLNRCPRCGALAKTPKAQQCRFCGHDWHDGPAKVQPPDSIRHDR